MDREVDFGRPTGKNFQTRVAELLLSVRVRLLLSQGLQGSRAFGHGVGETASKTLLTTRKDRKARGSPPGFFVLGQ
jgi:hypothetical protein